MLSSKKSNVQLLLQNHQKNSTTLETAGIIKPEQVRGHSLKKVLEETQDKVREHLIYGWHGMAANVTDGRYTYFRAPASSENAPRYNYCAIPSTFLRFMGKDNIENIEIGRFLKHTNYPVYKIPEFKAQNAKYVMDTLLFDIEIDYKQSKPVCDDVIEKNMISKLISAMKEADSPDEQFIRLGLENY